jgi:hypothetical protein
MATFQDRYFLLSHVKNILKTNWFSFLVRKTEMVLNSCSAVVHVLASRTAALTHMCMIAQDTAIDYDARLFFTKISCSRVIDEITIRGWSEVSDLAGRNVKRGMPSHESGGKF